MQLLTELCVCFSLAMSLPAGSFKIISRNGRLEKSVDAHRGACISLRWSYDGEGGPQGAEDTTHPYTP